MDKRKLSSYDRKILFPLKVIKVCFIIYCILNLFLPTYAGFQLGLTKLFSWSAIILMFIGVMGMHGYFNQVFPLPFIVANRIVQFVTYYLRSSQSKLNIYVFIILLIADTAMSAYMLADRASYCYEEEDE